MSLATSLTNLEGAVQPRTERALVSAVIPALNEGAQIADAVGALAWADEVIVVDGGSTDCTVSAAMNAGARVIVLEGQTIASQRNAGIEAARNAWILTLDADERVTSELRDEIASVVNSDRRTHTAYKIKFRNYYLGTELRHGPWGRDWHIRLFTRDRRFNSSRVHEHLDPIDDVGSLKGTMLHSPYRDLGHHVTKVVRYAKWGADDLRARGRAAGALDLIARPAWRFVRDYVVFSGWRDGMPGLIAAAISAFASFLKYAFLVVGGPSAEP